MKVKSESEVIQSCPTLCDPMDCSLPGSSVHGISRQEYWSGVTLPSPSEEQNEVKRMKRTEDTLRDLWDNIKYTNIQIIGVPEEEEKNTGYEKNF